MIATAMTVDQVLAELARLGSPSIKKTLMRHGAREPIYGVKVEDLKKLHKRIGTNHALALELYQTGVSDAMYLAGYLADPKVMKKSDLKKWLKGASWHMLSDYTVPWITAESKFGAELAGEWIESKQDAVASCGWMTFSSLVSVKPDDQLDLEELDRLLTRVESSVHHAPNRVRYTMNGFVIAAGTYVVSLNARAKKVAKAIGQVEVDMGDTACKVPNALEYLLKCEKAGKLGVKRKHTFC